MRHARSLVGFALAAALSLGATTARAERVTLDRPARLPSGVQKVDKTRLAGRVTAFDESGFDLMDAKGATQTVAWDDLTPQSAYDLRQTLIAAAYPKDTSGRANAYVELGQSMTGREGGAALADRAFKVALRLDPSLKGEIEKVKQTPATRRAGEAAMAEGRSKSEPAGGAAAGRAAGAPSGPEVVGAVQARFWGKLSDEEQAAHVKLLKAFADEAARKLNRPLQLRETQFFLFYSDLSPTEAQNWAGLLDRMYARLADLFGVPKGANVWRGKALIFVFQQAADYHRFQSVVHNTNSAGTDGMCHAFGDGTVHIAFYRQPNDLDFAHVLVHESVHGFLHRYRSPVHIVSWANEGLAEVIATELVPRNGRAQQARVNAKAFMMRNGNSLGGMLESPRIEAWQYPVAQALCEYMIQQSKRNYVDFINGMKDGLAWKEALETKYKAGPERLVPAFGDSLGMKELKE